MVSWRIIWVQLGCVAGAVICFYVLPGPNMLTLLCGIGAVLMQVLQRRHLERQRLALYQAAVAEWHREFDERMAIELARGITETQAEFLVRPVMEARQFWTYDGALTYMATRQSQPVRQERQDQILLPGDRP
jgi:hypothetical protein